VKRARTETGKVYDAEIRGKKCRVTVPEDPKPEELLTDALRENLSPHAVAAIAAYLQPIRTMDPEVVRQLRWFAGLLTEVVGGEDELNRLCEEVGL
jgi:hypothetical protein